jgi:hypothetical protein
MKGKVIESRTIIRVSSVFICGKELGLHPVERVLAIAEGTF